MPDGDPVPRSTTDEILGQVRDELRKLNDRAERDRGAGELREPAKPAVKRAAAKKKPAGSRRRDSKTKEG